MKYLILLILLVSCSPNLSKHHNDSVADRLRQRNVKVSPNNHHIKKKYAPVKAFKPSLK